MFSLSIGIGLRKKMGKIHPEYIQTRKVGNIDFFQTMPKCNLIIEFSLPKFTQTRNFINHEKFHYLFGLQLKPFSLVES